MGPATHVILYHASCNDGFCAAYVAYNALVKRQGTGWIALEPCQYGRDLPVGPDDVEGKHVYMLDFSADRAALEGINRLARSFVVLDHHKTAQAALKGLPFCTFDMDKSGAMLAWEHFHGKASAPWYVRYAQDRDLWHHRLAFSKEIVAAMFSYPRNIKAWNEMTEKKASAHVQDGRAILRYQEGIYRAAIENAGWATIGGHDVRCTNTTVLFSDIAGRLSEDMPFGAAYFDRADGVRVFSLRSRPPEGADVSEVALGYGGGGHKHAAGFGISPSKDGRYEINLRERK